MTWNEVHALNDAVKMMPSHGSLRTFRDRLFAASPDRPGLAAAPASPDWRHIANEWADVATNGIQAVKNVRDGVDTAEEAIARLKADIERCRELPPQAAAPAEAREITMTVEDAMRIVMANWGDKDAIERVFRANVAPADARHSDDIAVDAFAVEMKAKMAAARAKGRSGWETCAPEDLSRMLREHVEKGDPRDVANFCMMLHHHGASISGAADAGEAVASIANPLTPYGMLVRALRIVAGTTLMEMATGMGVSPAFLSSLEFGRRPVTYDNAAFASGFFSDNGVVDTLPALAHAVGLSQGAQGGKGGEA
nr:helix-turn-helix transcriptional regulator [Burkholderia gladioli]